MKIYHCYSTFDTMSDLRYIVSKQTWDLNSTFKIPIHESHHHRIFDDGYRKLPYIKDVIDSAFEIINLNENCILLFTNSDSCLLPSVTDYLQNVDDEHTQVYSRREIKYKFTTPLNSDFILKSDVFGGKDGFAFTKTFWMKYRHNFLDMLFGAEFWDYIFYLQLKMYSDLSSVTDVLYHQAHYSKWSDQLYRTSLPSQIYNIKLAKPFLYDNIKWIDRVDYFEDWENTIFKLV